MTKITTSHGSLKSIAYHPNCPFLKRPKITGEEIKDGVKYYLGEGKVFVASLFDRMFETENNFINQTDGTTIKL